MNSMNQIHRTFLRKSPTDLAIFKLVAYVTGHMLAYPEMRAYPEAVEAREKGLSSSQIRYFFRSYPEKGRILTDKQKKRLAFLDEARKNIVRLGVMDQDVLNKPYGWLSKQLTNKRLVGLMETQGLVNVNRRYKIAQDPHYYNRAFPTVFKSIIRSTPVSWMIPRTDKVVTTLVYLRPRTELIKKGPMKETFKIEPAETGSKPSLYKFEQELLKRCDAFGVEIRNLYETAMKDVEKADHGKDMKPSIVAEQDAMMRHVSTIETHGTSSPEAKKAMDDWNLAKQQEKDAVEKMRKKFHDYWASMPIIIINPGPLPDDYPRSDK